jgi:phage tail-like protein
MALSKSAMASYPLPVYNYRVTVGGETFAFSEVSGLAMEYDKVIYKDGYSYKEGPEIVRSQPREVNLTLKRGIVSKKNELFSWLSDRVRKDIFVDLCGPDGVPMVRWKVLKAMPLKVEAPTFSASGNDIAIETIQLVAAELKIEHI